MYIFPPNIYVILTGNLAFCDKTADDVLRNYFFIFLFTKMSFQVHMSVGKGQLNAD